jgi:two-component system, cell cycle response regulator DivK
VANLKLLLVDDAEDIRRMYQDFLESKGVRVVTAADGLAALDAVGYESPDAIVLDLAMPKMDGWEVIRHLKKEPWSRRIPILVLSGLDEKESALAAGANSYLSKPALPKAVLDEVRRLLSAPSDPPGPR